nr:hypothetical protein [Tanacetum cinerariifolium]
MCTRSPSNLIVESFTILKRRNRKRSKQIVEPELRTIVKTPVATMADTRTLSELLQAPTEGYGDPIAMLLQNKTPSPAPVKAIEEIFVTCGGPHPYYECLATDDNTFNASAATGTYNQGGHGYRPLLVKN